MRERSTLSVGQFGDTNAIVMRCGHHITIDDVNHAFKEVDTLLYQATEPLYVVLDLRTDPRIPLVATLQAASFGPYRNPRLKEWLIIGSSPVAHTIVRILGATTGRHNVRWFVTEDEVKAYLDVKAACTITGASRPGDAGNHN